MIHREDKKNSEEKCNHIFELTRPPDFIPPNSKGTKNIDQVQC